MTHPNSPPTPATQFERWQEEQRKWQQTVQNYMDTAAKDEEFLTHMGNAMRGSLLAGKAYPGSTPPAAPPTTAEATQSTVEELLFAVRRLEGQLQGLTFEVQALPNRFAALIQPDKPPGIETKDARLPDSPAAQNDD